MRFDLWTLALQALNFGILVWLMHRFLYKPVLRLVDQRRAEVDKAYADARAVAEAAKAEREAAAADRGHIEIERDQALKTAAADAEAAARARRARAEKEAERLLEDGRRTLAQERDKALAEVRRTALDLGTDVARRLLDEMPAELRAEAWLERIERHLAGLAAPERDELLRGVDGAALRVVTAVPLSEAARQDWRGRIGRALAHEVSLTFEADAALVAGVELHAPSLILRFSWRSAAAAMRADIEGHAAAS